MKTQWKIKTKIGDLYLVATEKGLSGIFWKEQAKIPMARSFKDYPLIVQAVLEITEYLDKQRKVFQVPLDLEGTPFQKSVWKCLLKIPYGETRSYADLARSIKNPKASRAVGSANAKNPISIIVPCHRVIRESGELGGYAGGLKIKEKLLALEGSMYIKGNEKSRDV